MDGMAERVRGVVKFFDEAKGYGFIRVKNQPDVFLHANALKRSGFEGGVKKGDALEFEVQPPPSPDGKPKAASITRV